MREFVAHDSIVRAIWGNTDLVLLVFAGSAAEFALNRAVDWLFFTNRLPQAPLDRLFSTARFAQEIVFADRTTAEQTLRRINAIHRGVEQARGARIPEWAFRDVLYMLIDYSERAYQLLYRPLEAEERRELYDVFRRVGAGLEIPDLPASYEEWKVDRAAHLERDLVYSEHTARLYEQYRAHLGWWRYDLLLEVQALLAPERVRRLLRLEPSPLLELASQVYVLCDLFQLRSVIHWLLLPPQTFEQVKEYERATARISNLRCEI